MGASLLALAKSIYYLFLCARYHPLEITAAIFSLFYFSNRAALGRNLHFFGGRMGSGGYHLTFRRTEGVITRNWEPLKKKSLKKNQGN